MDPREYRVMAETEDRHWWYVGRRAILAEVLASLHLPPKARILDVGAGTGGNLALLKRFGSVTAIERDAFARDYAARRSGVDVLDGALPDDIPVPYEHFDLICMFDVLEHVEEDPASVRNLAEHLKPCGRLLVTVPAYPRLWSAHDEALHHFRRYTRGSLCEVLEGAGLSVVRLANFNALMLPLAVIARALYRVSGRKASPGLALPRAPVNAAAGRLFASERHIVRAGGFPWGLSLLAVAQTQCHAGGKESGGVFPATCQPLPSDP